MNLGQHGGKRVGAGRKPSPLPPLVFVGARLTDDERHYLRFVGKGSISDGIRTIIAEHKNHLGGCVAQRGGQSEQGDT
jgi:hypothetical protein